MKCFAVIAFLTACAVSALGGEDNWSTATDINAVSFEEELAMVLDEEFKEGRLLQPECSLGECIRDFECSSEETGEETADCVAFCRCCVCEIGCGPPPSAPAPSRRHRRCRRRRRLRHRKLRRATSRRRQSSA